ncbi:hypothetical protein DFP97_107271 [Paenibacillus prosopidis]|uniref:Uncharacterized protein n=1 Tax=Paenibacillus prosopidis TaxID=630520 RepID=A0A368W075_9BACL|nr:hypothetical protein DFP97_107271 [Paenibacillus prosopidis]
MNSLFGKTIVVAGATAKKSLVLTMAAEQDSNGPRIYELI